MIEILIVGVTAFLFGLVLTPSVRWLAHRMALVDAPDGRRKLHAEPVALGGGLAVFISTLVSLGVATILWDDFRAVVFQSQSLFFVGLLASCALIVIVGLIDDRFHLRGRQKLLGQILAAMIFPACGLIVQNIRVLGWDIELGLLAYPFTMFWLLGAINALNLLDGLDGLAGSVGAILSLAIAGMAVMNRHDPEALVACALCGSLLAFLLYNFPPASIYLGDAGSMLIGLLLGALAMRSSFKGPATVALMAPTVIWAIPILDVGMAILRRKLTGRSIYETDRGHLHHCLLRSGFSNQMTLFSIGLFCTVTAVGALISVAHQSEWMAVVSAIAVFGALVVSRLFGYAECRLLGVRIKSMLGSFLPMLKRTPSSPTLPIHARITGTRDWEDLWETLTLYADRFDLSAVQLNVNLPALNEEYHVNWNRREKGPERQQWTADIPLIVGLITVGRLRIAGHCNEGSICGWMSELIEGLKPFEIQIASILSDQLQLDDQMLENESAASDSEKRSSELVETHGR